MGRNTDSASILGTVAIVLGIGLLVLVPTILLVRGAVGQMGEQAPPVAAEEPIAVGAMPIKLAAPRPPVGDAPFDPTSNEADATPEEPLGPAGPPRQIIIPRIAVDSSIVSVKLSRGEWPVPEFVVGHLAETPNPGNIGNAVFAGHIQTLAWGNVFARLKELRVGDDVILRSADGAEHHFRVSASRLVRNTDVSVIDGQAEKATVTLITCEGRWLPREKDYDQRRIVVAEAA